MEDTTNALAGSHSLYLQQHANQPVNWLPWSLQALNLAQKEDKLIVVSIGYASCHWCHVMAQESFEDKEIAQLMNENFISIKIDREERPDLDQVYMKALYLMNGRGGWPLNCILLPDGKPVFGGTYFPKKNWKNILIELTDLWKEKREEVLTYGNRLNAGIIASEKPWKEPNAEAQALQPILNDTWLVKMVDLIEPYLDFEWGGTDRVPKFPMFSLYQFLNDVAQKQGLKVIEKQVELTVRLLTQGGIFDHLEGGLARYSTDEKWHVPHFEKMLYDNALLLKLLATRFSHQRNFGLSAALEKLTCFFENWLLAGSGGFYAAIDADSEHEEGAFYTWTDQELVELTDVGLSLEFVRRTFSLQPNNLWEGKYILQRVRPIKELALEFKIEEAEVEQLINEQKQILVKARNKRSRPATDTLVISAWNGLAIQALARTATSMGRETEIGEKALQMALSAASYLAEERIDDTGIKRNSGTINFNGTLDDFAFVADGFIELTNATGDEKWIDLARVLTEYALSNFELSEDHLYYFSRSEPGINLPKTIEIRDNEVPSSNAILCRVLFILGNHFGNLEWIQSAEKMLQAVVPGIEQDPQGHGQWLSNVMLFSKPFYSIRTKAMDSRDLIAELEAWAKFEEKETLGKGKNSMTNALKSILIHQSIVVKDVAKKNEGITICQNGVCHPPLLGIEEVISFFKSYV